MTRHRTIRIAAAVLDRPDGLTLLVRKRGTVAFMQAGGKIQPGEDAVVALRRELHEELGLAIGTGEPRHLGRFLAPAANEPGCIVDADLFHVEVSASVTAAAEIEELAWVDPLSPGDLVLAPLTRDHVLQLSRRACSQG